MTPLDTLIVGAGIAGLTAAQVFQRQNQRFLLLDKGRGVGGRMATRRLTEGLADHGAASFPLNRPAVLELWQDALSRVPRQPAPFDLDAEAWVVPSGINALPKSLAEGLPIELNQTVQELSFGNGCWHSTSKEERAVSAKQILVTSPLWQTAELLRANQPTLAHRVEALAQQVNYTPQWTLIVTLASASSLPAADFSFQKLNHPLLNTIYHQGSKGFPQTRPVLVVQASQKFSDQYLETDASEISRLLCEALALEGWNLEGATAQAHRWRYARVSQPLAQSFVRFDDYPGLYLAGDFCLESNVMGAAESGRAAALRMTR